MFRNLWMKGKYICRLFFIFGLKKDMKIIRIMILIIFYEIFLVENLIIWNKVEKCKF